MKDLWFYIRVILICGFIILAIGCGFYVVLEIAKELFSLIIDVLETIFK